MFFQFSHHNHLKVIFIIGVSGCGKTTIGKQLAEQLNIPFFDADDFHPPENITKMSNGTPLNDQDRLPWLQRLNQLACIEQQKNGTIIACSALKADYRLILSENIKENVYWVYLKGTYSLIFDRMKQRDHFMPPHLLQSQFDTLEEPVDALYVSIDDTPKMIIDFILEKIKT